jgi:trk system potassium uptake protein TrkA
MNIVICGGDSQADYVIGAFKKRGNYLVVINDDPDVAKFLSEKNGVDVRMSDPTKLYTLEDAAITGFDIIISLLPRDVDNFVVCMMGKKVFGVKKAICTVDNPNNVALFQELGIDSPISASYLLTERIKGESDVESIIKTLSLENEKVTITEVKVRKGSRLVGMNLLTAKFPRYCNVCCIYRDPKVIIPRGDTEIHEGDTLIVACAPSDAKKVVSFVKRASNEPEIPED